MKVLLKSALVIDETQAYHLSRQDVLIEEGVIVEIAPRIDVTPDELVESENLHVSGGWFDLRVHATEPGYEHKETLETLARAAARGGFTEIVLLPNTKPVVQTKSAVQFLKQFSNSQLVNFWPTAAVTLNTEGKDFTEMLDLHQAGAVAFGDGAQTLWNADILLKTLQYLAPIGGVLMNRSEEQQLAKFGQMHEGVVSTLLGMKGIPSAAEEIAIARDLKLLEYSGVKSSTPRLHFSLVSSAQSVRLIREAKAKGLPVSCDVAAHQLVFTDEALIGFDTNLKVMPPFRGSTDLVELWNGLADGTIDAIVSDHCPQDEEGKNLEFDLAEFGMTGLETAFALVNTHGAGALSVQDLVRLFSVQPRLILGIKQPHIAIGEVANLTAFDPTTKWTFEESFSKSKNTPLLGKELMGKVLAVFNKKMRVI